jgi:CRP/FNR family transcriptional regulator
MAASCHVCAFRPSCIVAGANKDGLDQFSDALRRYSVKAKDRTIFNQGGPNEAFVFLCSGVVKVVKSLPDGRDVILEVLPASSILNVPPASQTLQHPFSAVTLSEVTELAAIKKEYLFNLLNSNPTVGDNLCGQVSRRFVTAFNMLSSMQLGVKERILTILSFFRGAWKPEDGARYVKIPLTQGELAQLIQTTPETISRTLRRLKAERLVRIDPKGEFSVAEAALRDYLTEE